MILRVLARTHEKNHSPTHEIFIPWWTFRIFFIFFCSGRGKGEFEAPGGGGGRFLIENPAQGGVCFEEGEGPGGVCGELGIFLGGGG